MNMPNKTELKLDFKAARKKLRNEIRTNKERKWKEFCATLERDPWGQPYRVVTWRLKGATVAPIPDDMKGKIVETLFVVTQDQEQEKRPRQRELQRSMNLPVRYLPQRKK